ncbi:hypothetical protein LINPERPRIM_LOCUS6977 [Linum perenne]
MDENMQELKIKLFAQRKTDGREYDLPTGDELAALIVNDSGQATYEQDIIVEHQNSRLERISVYHPSLMALQYPLLFPYGEDGWRSDIEVCSRTTDDDSDGKMAHINLEFCNKSRSIKYLFKYINKPPDRANAAIIAEDANGKPASDSSDVAPVIDEIKAFLDCRYLAAAEA